MGGGPGKVRALLTKMQGMVEVKVSCQECAVRRIVVFLLQAGGMRENIPWWSVYLEAKVAGDSSRLTAACGGFLPVKSLSPFIIACFLQAEPTHSG